MMGSLNSIPASAGAMPLAVWRGEKVNGYDVHCHATSQGVL